MQEITGRQFSCRNVYEREAPVLYIVHGEDGDWQLLCGGNEHDDANEIVVLHVAHLIERDPSLAEILDLDLGHEAERLSRAAEWVRRRSTFED